MTSHEHNTLEISIAAEERFAEGYFLPDRYLDSRICEKLWLKLMPTGRKLKDYSQVIVDFSDLPKKAAKMMPMHIIFSRMLAHASLREIIYQRLDYYKPLQTDFFLEKNLSRYWKKLPESFTQADSATLSPELQALMPEFLYEHDAKVLSLIANQEAYEALEYDFKDIADLVVNLLLIRIGSDELICKFLDEYKFLGVRQSKLIEYASKRLHENNGQHKAQDLSNKWKQFLLKLISDINESEDLNIGILSSIGIAINKVMQDRLTSPSVAFQALLDEDIVHYKNVTGSIINKCERVIQDAGEDLPEWLIKARQIIDETYSAPIIDNLSVKHCLLTQDYIEKRESIFHDQKLDLLAIDHKIKETYDLRQEISAIIAGNDLSRMSQMGDLGTKLAESVVTVNNMSSIMVDTFAQHNEALKVYLAALVADDQIQPEEDIIKLETPVAPLASSPADAEIRKLKTEISRLAKQLKKITALQESQLKRLTQTLIDKEDAEEKLETKENEIKALKEQLHAARQQMTYIHNPNHKPEVNDHYLAGLLRSHLKNERDDVESLLETFAQIAPDRLVVLPSAFRSAKEASNFELTARLAGIIDSTIYAYLDSIRNGIPDSEAKDILGNRYAAKESDTVFKNSKLRALREFPYNGETYYFEQHVGLGSGYGTQHAIRVHFKIIDNKVVIAYCGKHLETARTN